jgi:ADP-heptose:LPS heptosyltransferase
MKESTINHHSLNHMSNQRKVYAVRSLEESISILQAYEKKDFENLLKKAFIVLWVLLANCSLHILKFILFKKAGYTKKEFKNIVVYTVGIVGDNVVMLPALAALRRRYKSSKITVITNCQIWDQQGARGVLELSLLKDRLIVLDDHPVQRKGFRFLMDSAKFKGIPCDLFVNLSPFGNRGWFGAVVREMIFARKLGAQYAIGFRMSTYSRKGMFNKVQLHFVKNEPRRSKDVLQKLGLRPIENEDLFPHDSVAKETVLNKVTEHSDNPATLLVINPGAKFESKCWPVDRFAKVANYLIDRYKVCIVVTGNADERKIGEMIVKATDSKAINLAGKTTLQELVELLRCANGCVTNDTGVMHISSMIGTPTVAIFSLRLTPTHWLPVGKSIISLFSLETCKYCYDDTCQTKECLNAIEAEDVIKTLEKLLCER